MRQVSTCGQVVEQGPTPSVQNSRSQLFMWKFEALSEQDLRKKNYREHSNAKERVSVLWWLSTTQNGNVAAEGSSSAGAWKLLWLLNHLEPWYTRIQIWIHETYEFMHEKIIWIHSLYEFMHICEFIHIWIHIIIIWIHLWNDFMNSYTCEFICEMYIWTH